MNACPGHLFTLKPGASPGIIIVFCDAVPPIFWMIRYLDWHMCLAKLISVSVCTFENDPPQALSQVVCTALNLCQGKSYKTVCRLHAKMVLEFRAVCTVNKNSELSYNLTQAIHAGSKLSQLLLWTKDWQKCCHTHPADGFCFIQLWCIHHGSFGPYTSCVIHSKQPKVSLLRTNGTQHGSQN